MPTKLYHFQIYRNLSAKIFSCKAILPNKMRIVIIKKNKIYDKISLNISISFVFDLKHLALKLAYLH